MSAVIMRIEFLDFWQCSTGRGRSAGFDSVVARDELGLPMVPGKSIKGVLRDAVTKLAAVDDKYAHWPRILFGETAENLSKEGAEPALPKAGTDPGLIMVASARMQDEVLDWFRCADSSQANAMSAQLFTSFAQTAIEGSNGTARNKSLRVSEVAVPMQLTSLLSISQTAYRTSLPDDLDVSGQWISVLENAACFIEGFGANRTRGLGRSVVTFSKARS